MRYKMSLLLILSSTAFAAPRYQYQLKARQNFMMPFVIVDKEFDGSRPIEITAQTFTLKFKTTILEGKEALGLWLGNEDKEHSAVTLAESGQKSVYLNLLQGDIFGVAECRLKSGSR